MDIGQTIAGLRSKANMTQEQLASELYVSRELISKWETGKSPPNYKMILKLADLFSVGVDEIFDKESVLSEELSACVPAGAEASPEVLSGTVNTFLHSLSPRDRYVFIRRYYYFEDAFEIGDEYGLSAEHVRTILMRTRKKLKKYLKGALL